MIALISIFATITGNLILHRIYSPNRSGLMFPYGKNGKSSLTVNFLTNKIAGFIILGLIPGTIALVFYPQYASMIGLSIGNNLDYGYYIGLPALIVGINYFLAKYPDTQKRYPELRFTEWTKSRLTVLVLGWTIYLLGYEFLFRGLLFFSVQHSAGFPVSLAVNVILYSAVHYTKGKTEMIAAIPFGVLLCYMALLTESFFLPFLIHLSLALSTDFFSIKNNPEMKIVQS